jgi:hypothetical protein
LSFFVDVANAIAIINGQPAPLGAVVAYLRTTVPKYAQAAIVVVGSDGYMIVVDADGAVIGTLDPAAAAAVVAGAAAAAAADPMITARANALDEVLIWEQYHKRVFKVATRLVSNDSVARMDSHDLSQPKDRGPVVATPGAGIRLNDSGMLVTEALRKANLAKVNTVAQATRVLIRAAETMNNIPAALRIMRVSFPY